MTVKEKAQRYNEVLEKAKKELQVCGSADCDAARQIFRLFPELKKEENERIRKAILALVKQSSEVLSEQNQNNMIAWLENQELKGNPYSGVSFKYNNHTWGMCARDGGVEVGIDGQLKAFISLDKSFVYPTNPIPDIKPKSALEAVREEKVDNQNCIKPADKVEPKVKGSNYVVEDCGYLWNIDKVKPKFKVNDWIVSNVSHEDYRICKILKIENGGYVIESIYGYKGYNNFEIFEKYYHLWTIQDAKNGDVLADKYNNIGIFQECEGICWHSHIYLGCDGELRGFSIGGSHEQIGTQPATKEQRNALMKAIADSRCEWIEKTKELKKLTDKVRPKFHEGDWVIFNENHNSVYQVERIDNYRYYLRHYLGGTLSVHFDNELIRLWTIQDAKDGDMLQLGETTVIFKELISLQNCKCYCSAYKGEFEIPNQEYNDNNYGCHNATPATREQCNQLVKVMIDAGYTFDFKKKELKNISNTLEKCEIEHIEHGKYYYCIKDYYAGGNKRASKGDVVQALNGMSMMTLGVKANEYFIPVNTIKQMSTWSEEDENRFKNLIMLVNLSKENEPTKKGFIDFINRLKSLRPQKQWKPSDEQIEAFEHFVRSIGESGYASPYDTNTKLLYSLLEQLKKLK